MISWIQQQHRQQKQRCTSEIETTKLVHSKKNRQQNEKATYRMREGNWKPYI